MSDLNALIEEARLAFEQATDPAAVENAKARFMGKTGVITALMKEMSSLSPEQKRSRGAEINVVKQAIEALLNERRQALADAALNAQLAAESIDITLAGRRRGSGGVHPAMKTLERIEQIFSTIGFDVADGPEIETDFHNFTALNTPDNHPARSMHDTFYVEGGHLLRTHTSPMQVRYMQTHQPPIKVIAPGRVYRVDSDATHSPMFHQVEGLWVAQDVSFADLKAVFMDFLQKFFETTELTIRFRPSFFPFTEPSAEIDMAFTSGPNKGKWLEIAGSGQVHPNVLRSVGIDPEQYTGFAFGVGPDRLTMLRYGINDLRLFYENDLRFLKQFA
ncbi:MAG: phenylalanine--tRNA ligase subunit alpha [Burkholderiales bacterium]|jgi:phenylalanyl-tRNA synthetase alpha chain|nr:phenylalanine--tRNA ligase subunit alpha [Burkholderiales bacterium]